MKHYLLYIVLFVSTMSCQSSKPTPTLYRGQMCDSEILDPGIIGVLTTPSLPYPIEVFKNDVADAISDSIELYNNMRKGSYIVIDAYINRNGYLDSTSDDYDESNNEYLVSILNAEIKKVVRWEPAILIIDGDSSFSNASISFFIKAPDRPVQSKDSIIIGITSYGH